MSFEPGERFRYSNAGFVVLGAIIEEVSGQGYFDYVKEHIYEPAGMNDTDSYEMDRPVPNLAVGYTERGDGRALSGEFVPPRYERSNLFMLPVRGSPAGLGFSTVDDLLRFDTALRTHKLLSAEYTDLALAGKVEMPGEPGETYAYGFMDKPYNGKRITGHSGGYVGISAQLDMYLDLGYAVVVLSNYDPPAAGRVADRLRQMITQE